MIDLKNLLRSLHIEYNKEMNMRRKKLIKIEIKKLKKYIRENK